MSLSKTTNLYNRQDWENSDFPVLCQTCLGDNPYIRMIKDRFGKECKICDRPFTVFRWYVGQKMRFKKTEICQSCSKVRNVCQTCILDLEYGVPTQVRDELLEQTCDIPKSNVNKEYFAQTQNKITEDVRGAEKQTLKSPNPLLEKLARRTPNYRRNLPHICSFWVKGSCKRGEECPYRHELPDNLNGALSVQNIKDRYYGENDPVATKILDHVNKITTLKPPEDKHITTLYIGNIPDKLTEVNIRDHFYQYGDIRLIVIKEKDKCAFVEFTNRKDAEFAAKSTFNKLILYGQRVSIKWAFNQIKIPAFKNLNSNLETQFPCDYLNLKASDMFVLPPGLKLCPDLSNPPPPYSATFINSLP